MKKLGMLLLTGLSLSGCMYNNPELEQISNEKLIKQYFEHFNQHDWPKMASLYSENADFKDPSLGKGIVKQTRQQVIKKYTELGQAFPNVTDSILTIYPSGPHHVTVEFLSTGTAADQSKFELPICTIFTIHDGKIIKDYTYYDNF
jgi:ketosteroid isomerase-like protein